METNCQLCGDCSVGGLCDDCQKAERVSDRSQADDSVNLIQRRKEMKTCGKLKQFVTEV